MGRFRTSVLIVILLIVASASFNPGYTQADTGYNRSNRPAHHRVYPTPTPTPKPAPTPTPVPTPTQPLPQSAEQRISWVGYWDMYTPSEIDQNVQLAKNMNLNTLIMTAYDTGKCTYNSSIVPRWEGIQAGFDPLAYAVQQCHANGMKFYAWICVYYSGSFTTLNAGGYPSSHVAVQHPDWITQLIDGGHISDQIWLDPGVSAVKSYIISIVNEIIHKYDVDGICLDYIRYGYAYDGYSAKAIDQYHLDTGTTGIPPIGMNDPQFMQWKVDQVSDMVYRVKQAIDSYKPNCWLGAAIWDDATNGLRYFQQDSHAWMDRNLLDFAVPMTYTMDNVQWQGWVSVHLENAHNCYIFPAISLLDFSPADNPSGMVSQMNLGRALGCRGEHLFALNHIWEITDVTKRQQFIDAIKSVYNAPSSSFP